MKQLLLILAVIISIPATAAVTDSQGYYFYRAFNNAKVQYYIYNRYDSFNYYAGKAFTIMPGAFYTEKYEAACIYAREKHYTQAAVLFRQSIQAGMDTRLLDMDDTVLYAGFMHSPEYAQLQKEKTTLYAAFKSNLDIGFVQEIFWDIGADQVLRSEELPAECPQQCRQILAYAIDSANYISLKSYITEHGFPDFNRLDYVTKNTFSVIMNHYIPSRLDSVNGYFFLNLFNRKLIEGKVPNTFIIPALDYKNLLRYNKQLYGTYGHTDTAHKYFYNPFQNTDSIDVWRSRQCLPPLYVEYKMNSGIVLPEGYQYKKN